MGITVLVVPQDDQRPLVSSMVTSNVVAVENHSGLRHMIRGRTVSKVLLVDMQRADLNSELADALKAACAQHESETGAPAQYLEV